MQTPRRFQIFDSLNRTRTLTTGAEAYVRLPWTNSAPGDSALVLGLGPQPADIADLLGAAGAEREVAWVESPDFESNLAISLPECNHCSVPAHWRRLTPAMAEQYLIDKQPEVWAYRQASRLFPDFWGPVLADLQAALLGRAPRAGSPSGQIRPGPVLLPGTEHDLLHLELQQALTAEGFTPVVLNTDEREASGQTLKQALQGDRPAFFLSVNLRGLDAGGETFHLLQAMGVPVAIWFVDNPWHILSTLRLPWWKQARLFVTDATFIPGLKLHGAAHAFHLPLAASPLFKVPVNAPPVELPTQTRIFFAGRSAFPQRGSFFAAARLPDDAVSQAARLPLPEPNFHWWTQRLGLSEASQQRLWPGQDVRRAGLGAENASLRWRTQWLKAAAALGLTVAGDEGWKDLLPPEVNLVPPVDYYTALPGFYQAAPYSLSVTSLLLPGGLTQRHFDVWQAGGFLITAPTSGLEIFPAELTFPVTLDLPYKLGDCLNRFDRQPSLRRDLQSAWKKLLLNTHTFQHRIRLMAQLLV